MTAWTRTPTDWVDDPVVHQVADALRLRGVAVVGHLLCVWSKLPEFAPDGNLRGITPALLEQWARWHGKRGTFDDAMRRFVLDAHGLWPLWVELNGAVLRERKVDSERAAERRRLIKEAKEKQLDAFAQASADAIAKNPADGPPDGPALRTDVPSTTTAGARARTGNDPARFPARGYRPGDANLPGPPPWCAECGEGVPGHLVPGGKRGQRFHHDGCSLGPTPALEATA